MRRKNLAVILLHHDQWICPLCTVSIQLFAVHESIIMTAFQNSLLPSIILCYSFCFSLSKLTTPVDVCYRHQNLSHAIACLLFRVAFDEQLGNYIFFIQITGIDLFVMSWLISVTSMTSPLVVDARTIISRLPIDPVPSIIAVTVETAFAFP